MSHDKDLQSGEGETAALSANRNFQDRPHLIEAMHALRRFMRGKPIDVRFAATNVVYGLIAIARGRGGPELYAALGENIKRMGGR